MFLETALLGNFQWAGRVVALLALQVIIKEAPRLRLALDVQLVASVPERALSGLPGDVMLVITPRRCPALARAAVRACSIIMVLRASSAQRAGICRIRAQRRAIHVALGCFQRLRARRAARAAERAITLSLSLMRTMMIKSVTVPSLPAQRARPASTKPHRGGHPAHHVRLGCTRSTAKCASTTPQKRTRTPTASPVLLGSIRGNINSASHASAALLAKCPREGRHRRRSAPLAAVDNIRRIMQ